MKNHQTSQKDLVRRLALFYTFANLLNVWLNRRQLDADICFCIQSVVTSQVL